MPVDRLLPAAHNPRSRFSLAIGIIGLAGVAAIFLPFTFGISPLSAAAQFPLLRLGHDSVFEGLWPYGVPAMLTILVTVGSFRWIVTGRFSRPERFVAYLSALVAAGCILFLPGMFVVSIVVSMLTGHGGDATMPSGGIEWSMVAFPLLGSSVGAFLLRRNWRTGVPDAINAVAAMQVVYVTVAILSFAIFGSDRWQIGAYLVAVTTLVYLVQIVAVSVTAPGPMARAPK